MGDHLRCAAEELVPAKDKTYDLIGVPELAAEDPTPEVVAELEDALEIVRIIGEVCELSTVTRFFNGNPIVGAVTVGTTNFVGKEGLELWGRIGTLIDKHWDDVVDAIDDVITTPDVDAAAVATAEANSRRRPAPRTRRARRRGRRDRGRRGAVDEEDVTDETDESDDLEDDFWSAVGIDPIRIVTDAAEYLTLRCYLGDDPVFLGKDGKIFVFHLGAGTVPLRRAVRRPRPGRGQHLRRGAGRRDDGSLEVDVYDENVYVLPASRPTSSTGPAGWIASRWSSPSNYSATPPISPTTTPSPRRSHPPRRWGGSSATP